MSTFRDSPGAAENPGMLSPGGCAASLWKGYVLTLALAGSLYLATVAPGPLWQDSGMAQHRTLHRDLRGNMALALSHPLYYLFTGLFQWLPFDESAYKTNLVSAVFGAFTVANVLLLLRVWTRRWFGAALGAMSVGVAHTFWQHCALAEVYTVTTTLLTTELLCIQQYLLGRRSGWLILVFLINGLGVSNHLMALLSLLCVTGLAAWALWRREVKPGFAVWMALAWLAGAGLYFALIGRDLAQGMGLAATLRSALTGGYEDSIFNVIPSRNQLLKSALYLGLNFPTPVVLLAIVALAVRGQENESARLRWFLLAETLIYLLWAVRYDVPDQYTFFIPVVVLLGVWIGLGADRVIQGWGSRWRVPLSIGALLPVLVYAPLPAVARRLDLPLGLGRSVPYRDEYQYFLWPWKTGYHGAEHFVEELGQSVPGGSVVILDTTTVKPVWYAQDLGRWNRSIEVRPRVPRPGELRERLVEKDFIEAIRQGRVFVLTPVRSACPEWLLDGYRFDKHGMVYRVREAHPVESSPATSPP